MIYDPLHPLHKLAFEWHDLPVERISIVENGVVIDVRPYNDEAERYHQATLSLLNAKSIKLDLSSPMALEPFKGLQIMDLDVVETVPGRVTGMVGIMLGFGDDYWRIYVTDAAWQVTEQASSAPQSSANDA